MVFTAAGDFLQLGLVLQRSFQAPYNLAAPVSSLKRGLGIPTSFGVDGLSVVANLPNLYVSLAQQVPVRYPSPPRSNCQTSTSVAPWKLSTISRRNLPESQVVSRRSA